MDRIVNARFSETRSPLVPKHPRVFY